MSYNKSILSSPNSPEFEDHLHNSIQNLKPSNADDFFSVLFSNFSKKPILKSPNIGNLILDSISQLCSKKLFIEILVRNDAFLKLPYDNPNFTDSFLDIFFRIVTLLPTSINSDISLKFQQLIPKSPQKCLTLLAYYSEKFEFIYSPWSFLDSLFLFSSFFSTVQCASNYAALLAVLIRSYPDFRTFRGKVAWKQLLSLLSLPNSKVICYIYGALGSASEAFDSDTQIIYPSSSLSVHLIRSETRYAALNFILRCPPPESCPNLNSLIHSLLEVTLFEIRATLPLLWLTQTNKGSQFFLQDLKWMSALPIISATRITATLLIQPNNYYIILESPHFITLLHRLSTIDDSLLVDEDDNQELLKQSQFSQSTKISKISKISQTPKINKNKENINDKHIPRIKCGKQIVCYFLNSTPIDEQVINNLSSSGTLSNLLSLNSEDYLNEDISNSTDQNNNNLNKDSNINKNSSINKNSNINKENNNNNNKNSQNSQKDKEKNKRRDFIRRIEFLIAERIGNIGMVPELIPMTDRCIKEMKENGPLADVAAAVSLTLAQYTKCAQKLIDANLQDLLSNIPQNSNYYDLLSALVSGLQKL